MKRLIFVALCVLSFLVSVPVAASSQRVTLTHMSFTLPDYISPVDVGTGREAEFHCLPPDQCMVFADFYAAGTFFPYAEYPSDAFALSFEDELLARGIDTTQQGMFQTYYTGPGLSGDRTRIFVNDGYTDFAVDFYLTYSADGTRLIVYVRPAEWTLRANGNGQPVFERLLDSLTINFA